MRRIPLVVTAVLGGGLLLVTAGYPVAAWAAPSPAPVPSAVPGQSACDVDSALAGITGLTATANGYALVVKPESGLTQRVYVLDSSCKRGKSLAYGGAGPNSPQDIQITSDGTLWVADTGDNLTSPTRKSIGLWKFSPDGKNTLFRFTYPDRALAAQAMLISPDGNPVFITDATDGPAGIFVPAAPLDPSGKPVALKHAGDFQPQQTGTDNTLGRVGQNRVSGAATSPDGKKIVLRTYSDAYEWTVNGDVVTTITTATPRITPLPGEPLGEAISYSTDGTHYLTVSDVINKQSSTATQILKYTPATPPTVIPGKVGANPGVASKGDTRDWLGKLGFQELLNIVIAIGVIGVLMVVLGIVGIRRSRRKPAPPRGRGAGAYDDGYDDEDEDPRAAARARTNARSRARVPERYDTEGYDSNGYDTNGYDSGGYDSGGYDRDPYPRSGGRYESVPPPPPPPPPPPQTYGAPRYSSGYDPEPGPYSSGYEPDPYDAPAPPRAASPAPAPGRERGVARTHRPGRRGSRDDTDSGRRGGGYADEHQGFGDMLGD
jgi:hypothetical protein